MIVGAGLYIFKCSGKSFPQLIRERNSIVKDLKRLENIICDKDKANERWKTKPSPVAEYKFTLDLLTELSELMKNVYDRDYNGIDFLIDMRVPYEDLLIQPTDITG